MIKSPLRWVGAKSKHLDYILPHIPNDVEKYVEPFAGGLSVGLAVLDGSLAKTYHFNDKYKYLMNFWLCVNNSCTNSEMRAFLWSIVKAPTATKKAYFRWLKDEDEFLGPYHLQAAQFYFINRCAYSGNMRGGFSKSAAEDRFTESSIERLANFVGKLDNVELTAKDYKECLKGLSSKDLAYCDPPYLLSKGSNTLYIDHEGFDHVVLSEELNKLDCRALISYNDCQEILDLYPGWTVHRYEIKYGAANGKVGKEILLRNY